MTTLEIIKMLCKQKGTSLKALEKNLGFSNGSLAKSETIKVDRLQKIADYFNVTINYLMTGELRRQYLPDDAIAYFIALAEHNECKIKQTLSSDMGVTLTIKAPGQKESVDLRNHEIIELMKKMNDYTWGCIESMISEKYQKLEYHRERTEEELIAYIFGDDRTAEDALAELSTYEDAEIVSFIRKANELKKQKLNAAHTRTDVTPSIEDILHDEDLMDDDDF